MRLSSAVVILSMLHIVRFLSDMLQGFAHALRLDARHSSMSTMLNTGSQSEISFSAYVRIRPSRHPFRRAR